MVRGAIFNDIMVRQNIFQCFMVCKLKKFGKHCCRHMLYYFKNFNRKRSKTENIFVLQLAQNLFHLVFPPTFLQESFFQPIRTK